MMKPTLLCVLLVAACSDDPAGPDVCARMHACEVAGVDLAVIRVHADSMVDNWADLVPVLDAGNVDVEFTVVNRGDQTSPANVDVAISAFGAQHTAQLPTLQPGDSALMRVPITIGRSYLYAGTEPEAQNITTRILHTDANAANNVLNSALYTLNVAYVGIKPVRDPMQTVRVGESFLARWRTDIGFMSGVDVNTAVNVLICLRAGTQTCTQNGWQALARVEQHASFPVTIPVHVVPAGLGAAGTYDILVCTVPRAHRSAYIDPAHPDHHCEAGGQVRVVPS